jgi:glucokinase
MRTDEPERVLALDFGGTKASAALLAPGSSTLARHVTIATPDNAEATSRELFDAVVGMLHGVSLTAIGISFGGPVDTERGIVTRSHHRAGWADFPLTHRVTQQLGAPAVLLNDADAGALGEAIHGAGQGHRDLIYLTISTGIGAGVVLDGRIHRGGRGLAGELGHLPLTLTGPTCSCGRQGCLEAYASGPSIARQAREALVGANRAGDHTAGAVLRAACDYDLGALTARHVGIAASMGDRIARAVMDAAGQAVGQACAMAALILDPDIVVLGGGVAKAGELLTEPAQAVFTARVMTDAGAIVTAALGDACTLVGAAEAATRQALPA